MRRHYRSYFWPAVLIVIGLIALLVDLNVISADRLYRLADLWPLILIVIGLELIVRRTAHGMAMDIATVLILLVAGLGAIAYVAAGPAIPGGSHTLTTSDAVGTLSSASLDVEVGAADLSVVGDKALGADLYKAVVTYSGPMPEVTLDRSSGALRISQPGEFGIFGSRHLAIDLHINPSVAWSFSVNGGATNATLNLTGVQVISVEANNGASRLELTVGPPKGLVAIRINGGAPNLRFHRLQRSRGLGPALGRRPQPDGGRPPCRRDRQRQLAIGRLQRRHRRLFDRGQRGRVQRRSRHQRPSGLTSRAVSWSTGRACGRERRIAQRRSSGFHR